MKRNELMDLIIVHTPGTPAELRALRERLSAKTTEELEKTADQLVLESVRASAQKSPEALKYQQQIEQINRQRREDFEEYQFCLIFRTPVNGRVPADNIANRQIIRGWVDEIQDEIINPVWFLKVLEENPGFANQLVWQSAEALDPGFRRKAEQQQQQEDRQTFNKFARQYGYSEGEANVRLTLEILGSGFTTYDIVRAVESNTLKLALARPEELEKFKTEAAQIRQDFLIHKASPNELRQAAREEFQQRRAELQKEDFERQIETREQLDASFGFPPLPNHNGDGIAIDAAYLNKISNTNLPLFKALMRKHGAAALTRRLHGRG